MRRRKVDIIAPNAGGYFIPLTAVLAHRFYINDGGVRASLQYGEILLATFANADTKKLNKFI